MSCERLVNVGARHHSVDLSRCEQYVLTWVRALPGIRVIISVLASQMMTVVGEGSFSIRAGISSGRPWASRRIRDEGVEAEVAELAQ